MAWQGYVDMQPCQAGEHELSMLGEAMFGRFFNVVVRFQSNALGRVRSMKLLAVVR